MPKLDGAHLPQLLDELDATLRELIGPFERDPSWWTRAFPGKWSAGQQVEHIASLLSIGADALERAAEELLRGDLGARPWRDPFQRLFVFAAMRTFPKAGRAPAGSVPGPAPDPTRVLARLAQGVLRYRALGERLSVEQRDRLWIWNPYAPRLRWHYTFAELVRVQTTHALHHARRLPS